MPAKYLELSRWVRSALASRARVLLVDFWTNIAHTDPVFAALMAGEFAVLQPEGDIYSVDEGRASRPWAKRRSDFLN